VAGSQEDRVAQPVIIVVDDQPDVLNAVERDLRGRFGAEYRVVKAASGDEALEAVRELKRRGALVALFLVDQRMPVITGTEFLADAIQIYPDAKRVLLTAYSDTQAAITSINLLGLDHYLLKPWDPPEREFFPVLEDLLADWTAAHPPAFEGIRVLGTLWSAKSHRVKDFLSRNQIPYLWLDVEKDAEGKRVLMSLEERHRLPALVFPDGSVLIDPELDKLAEKVGLQTRAARPFYDLLIIGGGPAGLGASVYGASEGLSTLLIEKEATGGQAGTSALIENYLGFPKGLSGADLARRATTQARRFGAEILIGEVVGVRVEGPYRYVSLKDGSELSCHALLIATGVSVRKLEAQGVERLTGVGIYYGAAITEAMHYKGQDVIVVGGANSAGQGAIFLSRFARTVHLVVRGDSLDRRMSSYLVEQIKATANIQVVLDAEVAEARGDSRLESVIVAVGDGGEQREIAASAMFLYIGATAHTKMVNGTVARDATGFILTGQDLMVEGKRPAVWTLKRDPLPLETSVPGIFAAGDVRHMSVKRVGAAVGESSAVIALIHQYLKTV
jgi:thioredoxin reductase (NADPH)